MSRQRTVLICLLLFCFTTGCVAARQQLDPQQLNEQEKEVVRLLELSVKAMRNADAQGLRDAESALELARELKPGDPRVYDGLGAVAFRRGDTTLAEYFFKKALAQDALYDRAYAHLAMIAEQRGDIDVAVELLKIAVQTNPTNYRSRNNFAVVLANHKIDSRRAYDELLKAMKTQRVADRITNRNLELLAVEGESAQ